MIQAIRSLVGNIASLTMSARVNFTNSRHGLSQMGSRYSNSIRNQDRLGRLVPVSAQAARASPNFHSGGTGETPVLHCEQPSTSPGASVIFGSDASSE